MIKGLTRILCHAFFVKAWETNRFIFKAITVMTTLMHFVTALIHHIKAVFAAANILKC